MALLPEGLSAETIEEKSREVFDGLSRLRGYEVNRCEPVCILVVPLLAQELSGATWVKLPLKDGAYQCVIEVGDGVMVDVTWLCLIDAPHREGLPDTLVFRDQTATGLRGEKIPPEILDMYFGQYQ